MTATNICSNFVVSGVVPPSNVGHHYSLSRVVWSGPQKSFFSRNV